MKGLLIIAVVIFTFMSVNSQNMFREDLRKGYKRIANSKYYRLYSQYYGTYTKRSSDFYSDPENYGYYAYHGKGYKRSSDFYDRPENYGYYAYHGKGYKRSSDFYDRPENYGYYAYHGKGYKRSSDFYDRPENYGYYAYHGKGYKRSPELPRPVEVEVTLLRDFRTKRFMRRTIPKLTSMDFRNITTCQYKSDNGTFLSCTNSLVYTSPLVCQVDLNMSSIKQFDFKMFGVESLVGNSTEKKFHLYPFKVNEKTSNRIFYNYQILLNQEKVELALYHSSETNRSGINVKDKECYNKLTNLLEKSSKLKTIDFEISSKNALTKILFIGDIFIE